MELEKVDASPFKIVHDVQKILNVRAEEKGIYLNLDFPAALPETVCTDPVRLRQVVTNLVGNAIKFTSDGGVTVVTTVAQRKGKTFLKIDVQDTGIGMNANQIERIFEAFVQADTTITRRFGGTGLGLAISKKIAVALGGDVTVTSHLGAGSTFTAQIDIGDIGDTPLVTFQEYLESAKEQDRNSNASSQLYLGPKKILIVDDGDTNRKLVRLILKRAGCKVSEAANGREGVEKAMAGDFDLILMDMQMPILDGYQATKQLRKLGYDRPIIALTANVLTEDEKKCQEYGCSGFLPKPLNIDRLIQTIADQLSIKPAEIQCNDDSESGTGIEHAVNETVEDSTSDSESYISEAARKRPGRISSPIWCAPEKHQPGDDGQRLSRNVQQLS